MCANKKTPLNRNSSTEQSVAAFRARARKINAIYGKNASRKASGIARKKIKVPNNERNHANQHAGINIQRTCRTGQNTEKFGECVNWCASERSRS